jgi:hypothetical protein
MIGYHTKWPTGWTNEWFYMKVDGEGEAHDHGNESPKAELRHDSVFVQHAARVPLPTGLGIQGGG